jgi:SAM-dependent methyltransferase/adenylate kinase family enzyme
MRRVLVFGNAGSGKTTLAAALRRDHGLAHLDLDTLAWQPTSPPVRRHPADSGRDIRAFTARHDAWVIEGCYADLLALLLDHATEVVFMNPGVDVCERHCRSRPWEPHKYASAEAQDRNLAMLLDWVRSYPARDDACSLASHRRLFDAYDGLKREVGGGREGAMYDTGLQAQIARARAYEAVFVRSLIGVFAPIVADAAAITSGDRVLDVACGTGVLAREAAVRAGAGGEVVGLDVNAGMLAVAREHSAEIAWREGAAETLPFPDGSFDAVVSQFGLMFFEDRRAAIREMHRVLRPGGRLAIAVWDGLASMPAFAAEVALLQRVAGQRAADLMRVPFVLGDRASLACVAAEGGLERAAISTHAAMAHFCSVRALVEADLRGWLPRMGVSLPEPVVEATLAEADDALAPYVTRAPDGSVSFPTSAHLLCATAV